MMHVSVQIEELDEDSDKFEYDLLGNLITILLNSSLVDRLD